MTEIPEQNEDAYLIANDRRYEWLMEYEENLIRYLKEIMVFKVRLFSQRTCTWQSERRRKHMSPEQLWKEYCAYSGTDISTHYEAWAFGGAPDKLADLVLKGIKTATASAYDLFAMDDTEPLPKPGDYSVILNSKDEAVCVIRTVYTEAVPFNEVSEEHAYLEGEGDRSLSYWRDVHKEFFTDELMKYGLAFSDTMTVLCERFEVCYKP